MKTIYWPAPHCTTHDWPVTNLATGEVYGLCWLCGMSAEEFKKATKERLAMTNIYRFECRAICPVHAELIDVYQVEVRSCSTIPVETILEYFKQYETTQIFQEDMTKQAATALGCSVSTTGMHSGVEVVSYAP